MLTAVKNQLRVCALSVKYNITNGFPSTAAFNKSFRELYQESPSSFRQARREQAAAARADTEFSHIVAGFDAAPASAAAEELLISVRQSAPYYAGWSDTINIGFLPNALSTRFHETFQSFQRAIGFRDRKSVV